MSKLTPMAVPTMFPHPGFDFLRPMFTYPTSILRKSRQIICCCSSIVGKVFFRSGVCCSASFAILGMLALTSSAHPFIARTSLHTRETKNIFFSLEALNTFFTAAVISGKLVRFS